MSGSWRSVIQTAIGNAGGITCHLGLGETSPRVPAPHTNLASHDHFLLLVFLLPALVSPTSPFSLSRVPSSVPSRTQHCLCRRGALVHSTHTNTARGFSNHSAPSHTFFGLGLLLRTKASERARDSSVDRFQNSAEGPQIEKVRHNGFLLAIFQQP